MQFAKLRVFNKEDFPNTKNWAEALGEQMDGAEEMSPEDKTVIRGIWNDIVQNFQRPAGRS